MKIVVLGGGVSPERLISLRTSEAVLNTLRELGHKAIFVDLFLGLESASEDLFESPDGLRDLLGESYSASLPALNRLYKERGYASVGPHVLEICRLADFVFLGLHGEDGEDGRVQGMLDLFGVPYNGSGSLGSAMAMDKAVTRQIMQLNGVNVAPLVTDAPCVVKLLHSGSSIGLQVCDTDEELRSALDKIGEYGDDYIVERKIEGTEVTVGVLGDTALPPLEMVPPEGRYLDYEVKYATGTNAKSMICPARIPEEQTREVQRQALLMHRALKLSGYSRTDFIIDREGRIWGLEVNTLSGFTGQSILPIEAREAGISYGELCRTLIELGLERSRAARKTLVSEMTR